MKRLLSTLTALAVLTGTAMAADAPGTPKAPAKAPALFNWTGFYFGAHGGYAWANAESSIGSPMTFGPFSADIDGNGFLYGGQFGAQYQLANNIVLGAEVNYSKTDVDGTAPVSGATGFTAKHNMRNLLTAEAKIGYVIPGYEHWLPYGTIGFACAESKLSISSTGGFAAASNNVDSCEWTVGAGLEYAFWGNAFGTASLFGKYQYMKLGSSNPTFPIPGAPGLSIGVPLEQEAHLVKVGVNWRM